MSSTVPGSNRADTMTPPAGDQMTSEREQYNTDVNEHFITKCFSQLTSDDGSPDVPRRQASLRNLIKAMSPWEVIYLRSLIRKTTIKLADMHDLPDEIVATISGKLDYRDVLNCTEVSKEWRRTWTAELVVKDVARAHFPGLIESHPEASPWSLLHPVAAKATARAQGRYISSLSIATTGSPLHDCTALKLDDRSLAHAKHNPSPAEPAARDSHAYRHRPHYGYAYCDGRIAWQWDAYSFFIDDIRAMTRTLASPSDLVVKGDKDFVVSGLSKTLLILANSRTGRALNVYHLKKNQHRRVTLPSRMHEISLHNETFVVTFNASLAKADPHIWHWGGGLAKLKVPNFPDTIQDLDRVFLEQISQDATCNVGFVFHPDNNGIVYLVTAFLVCLGSSSSELDSDNYDAEHIKTHKCVIMIYKFDNMKYLQTFSYETTMIDRFGSLRLSLRCRPMNPYGLYNLCALVEHTSAKVVHCKLPGAKFMQTPSMTLFHVNFNTVNETFSHDTRELNGIQQSCQWVPEPSGGILWNDLTYYILTDTAEVEDDVSPGWECGVKLRGVRALCIADKSSTLVINEDSSWFSEEEGPRSIAVDEDFLVAISDKEYFVWNFGDFGLRDEPWKRGPGFLRRLRLIAQDTYDPFRGCSGLDDS
ncbi:hypothetical protein ColLi_06320 [Colletotrichum liriopes]|uniref:F-box domain-containing protein n=1 Tax=Colletotrichum liriopes TaxID=708192 RepID=A0AA37GMI5_9PEZI|nr:hypothetical protein ColLi_06320 [Colletotrichum liriopes]